MTHDFISYKVNMTIFTKKISCLAQFIEYCPAIVQSHIGIEIQTLGKSLCTGPLQKIQFFSSTPENEVTARVNSL